MSLKKQFAFFISLALIGAVSSPVKADEGFTFSAGTDYSSGKYGSSESTDIWYVPFSAQYDTGRFTYKITVPWIRVTGNGSVVPGGIGGSTPSSSVTAGNFGCAADNRNGASKAEDNGPCAGVSNTSTSTATSSTSSRTTNSGLGDVVAAVIYNVFDNTATGLVFDVSGRIKFATASESKGLGSGKNDYAIQGYLEKAFGAPFLSAGLGYKWLGRTATSSFDSVTFGSVGGGYKFSSLATVGLSYDTATASTSGGIRPKEVSIYGSYKLNKNYKLSGVIYKGLSDASPDAGGGLTAGYNW